MITPLVVFTKYPSPATAVKLEVLTACHDVPPDTSPNDNCPTPVVPDPDTDETFKNTQICLVQGDCIKIENENKVIRDTNAGDYIFRNYPSDSSQASVLGNLASFVGVTKIGTITEENDYTIGLEKVFVETFETNGGEAVEESFLSTDTDFKTQITKLKGEGVNGIFINPQTPAKADLIQKQIKE